MSSESKDRAWVWLLCGVAVLRVFIYSAAFPFFNNVDEYMHFDAALKYSHGEFPPGRDRISAGAADYITACSSPEYFQDDVTAVPPPVWAQNQDKIRQSLQIESKDWQTKTNYEYSSPPLYYAVAGAWLDVGRAAGLKSVHLLYWIRFLNLLPAGLLVWLGYLAACAVFPENRFLYLGTPALLAAWPQDLFYAIQSDVLSPLCFGAAFVGLLLWARARTPDWKLAGLTGLALAAGCFNKTSNAPLLAVGAAMFLLYAWRMSRSEGTPSVWPSVGVFLLSTIGPIVLLCFWNLRTNGDIGGSAQKVAALGWTHKPFADWWSHPIFTPGGFGTFWWGLMVTFWRGELIWHSVPVSRPAVDAFYCYSTTILFVLALASLFVRRTAMTREQRQTIGWCFASVGASVAFLILLSIVFDFGDCIYPSRAYPYFVSGRLISGVMLPFAMLYVQGLDWMLSRQHPRSKWLLLAGVIAMMFISEIVATWPVFFTPYNWFHV